MRLTFATTNGAMTSSLAASNAVIGWLKSKKGEALKFAAAAVPPRRLRTRCAGGAPPAGACRSCSLLLLLLPLPLPVAMPRPVKSGFPAEGGAEAAMDGSVHHYQAQPAQAHHLPRTRWVR